MILSQATVHPYLKRQGTSFQVSVSCSEYTVMMPHGTIPSGKIQQYLTPNETIKKARNQITAHCDFYFSEETLKISTYIFEKA